MTATLKKLWKGEEGVLTFEWILLVTLLTIGIVSGLTAARDAIIDELSDVAEAMLAVDQSFTVASPLKVWVHSETELSSGAGFGFTDNFRFEHCDRTGFRIQGITVNCDIPGTN